MHWKGRDPQRRPQRQLGRRLEEVAEAVGGGYCWLQMPLRLALGVRGTVAGHRLGALEGGGGTSPFPIHPRGGLAPRRAHATTACHRTRHLRRRDAMNHAVARPRCCDAHWRRPRHGLLHRSTGVSSIVHWCATGNIAHSTGCTHDRVWYGGGGGRVRGGCTGRISPGKFSGGEGACHSWGSTSSDTCPTLPTPLNFAGLVVRKVHGFKGRHLGGGGGVMG